MRFRFFGTREAFISSLGVKKGFSELKVVDRVGQWWSSYSFWDHPVVLGCKLKALKLGVLIYKMFGHVGERK